MALNADILSTILTFLGIKNLHVHFDSNHERIDATFDQHGQHHERKITFTEMEQLFANDKGPTSPANGGGGS